MPRPETPLPAADARRPLRAAAAVALLGGLLLPSGAAAPRAVAAPAGSAAERRLTLFYTGEIHGVLEPCGCTSDPLGDIARYGALVEAARREKAGDAGAPGVVLVDGGNLSFREGGIPAKKKAADQLRAGFLADELKRIGLRAAGLGETDLAAGPALVLPRRSAVNLGPAPALEAAPAAVETAGGIKLAVFGVADPALAATLGVKGEEPVAAARREVERLRQAGAELVVVLAPVEKAVARRLAREAGADVVVLGRQVGAGLTRAEPAGSGFLVASADELQKVGRLDLVLRGEPGAWRKAGPLVDAGGPEAAKARREELARAIARADEELARWSQGDAAAAAGADRAFVANKRRERDALAAERARLEGQWVPPVSGSYFTNHLIPLRRSLPRGQATAAAMRKLDARVGALNLRTAAPAPPPEAGRASYVGMAKCAPCHKAAVAFWNKTVHAQAWETLVGGGKQADYDCVSCHVTGYGQVGGSSLGHTKRLEDVQCETCHGPGSIHVAEKGLEEPSSVHRQTPESTCTSCHSEHHSDTFQYQAYLRDILGPGHGAAAREKLGDGPTGHTLRSAALAKAKAAGADQLKKM